MGPFFKVTLSGLALQDLVDSVQESIVIAQKENNFHKLKERKSLYNTLREQLEKEGLLFIIEEEKEN